MFGLGTQELLFILIAVILLFGGTQIPRIMRGFGQGIREFKTAVKDETKDADDNPTANCTPKQETTPKNDDTSSV